MLKLMLGIRRRPDIDPAEFAARWRGGHAAILCEVADTIGVRRYVQGIGVHPEISAAFARERGSPPPFEGIAETSYEDFDDLRERSASPEGQAALARLAADGSGFHRLDQSVLTLVEEHPIIAPASRAAGEAARLKIVFGLRRKPGLSREEFWDRWHGGHAALARELAEATGIRRYTQSPAIDPGLYAEMVARRGGPAPFDGFAEAWFAGPDSLAAARETAAGAAAFARLLEDEQTFLDVGQCVFTLVTEHVVLDR